VHPKLGLRHQFRAQIGGDEEAATSAAPDDTTRIEQLLAEAAITPLPEDAGLSAERAEELITEIRGARDAR
jgi:hypothetical protein